MVPQTSVIAGAVGRVPAWPVEAAGSVSRDVSTRRRRA
jgi:hypothetical protein